MTCRIPLFLLLLTLLCQTAEAQTVLFDGLVH